MLTTLIEQYQAYLHLQHRISKAIYNQDERLVMHLKQASQENFHQIEDTRTRVVEAGDFKKTHYVSRQSDLSQLVQVMERAHQQVRENEKALQLWLDQMKSDVQNYRRSQSPQGVLATYIQQRPGASSQSLNFEPPLESSKSESQNPIPPAFSSPWTLPGKASDTTGHQVNHQS